MGSLSGLRLLKAKTSRLTTFVKRARLALLSALAVLCCLSSLLSSSPAYAVPTEPSAVAEEAISQLTSGALSKQQSHKQLVNLLAGKWFNASSEKRAKVPLTYQGQGQSITEPGSLDSVYLSGDLQEFANHFQNMSGQQQYEQWLYYFGNRGDSFLGVFSTDFAYRKDYLINSYSGDGALSYGSDEELFQSMYWYDWFEGTTPSSGGNTPTSGPYGSTVTLYALTPITNDNVVLTFGTRPLSTLNGLADGKYSIILGGWEGREWDASGIYRFRLYVSDSPLSVGVEPWDINNQRYNVIISSSTGVRTSSLDLDTAGTNTVTYVNSLGASSSSVVLVRCGFMYSTQSAGGGGSDTPVWPIVPEPDTPNPPTTPDNVTYVVNQGDTVTHVTNSTTTTTVDLTPILEAIRAVNSNIISYGNALNADFDTLSSNIAGCFETFTDYFGEWMETISGQLQVWNEQFLTEIRIVENWLEGIFYKIPGGGSSVPDPTTDEEEYFDWLKYLINLILEKLGLLDSLTDFANLFAQLRTVFPFSVPWDIAAILGLFAHEPVTPVFDMPYPTYVNGQWIARGVACDLTPWNTVAQVCRTFIRILFAYYLALWTREGLKNFEVSNDD